MIRDPGLQPERTAMSWMRTQLLLFVVSALIFRIAEWKDVHWLALISILTMLFSAISTLYVRQRFESILNVLNLVGRIELLFKMILSISVFSLASAYLIMIWIG